MINTLLHDNSMTKYRLSKLSGIPYTTINDICSGKADIKKCSVDNVYRIAKVLGVTVEELLEPYYIDRPDFELFKSNTCHRLKEIGENNIPLCGEYDDMRRKKLAAIVYPRSVLALCAASKDDSAKEKAVRSSIPEFLRHNIVESEVRNVI